MPTGKPLTHFKGSPIFIPGNHDWYNEGPWEDWRDNKKYIQKELKSKDVFS